MADRRYVEHNYHDHYRDPIFQEVMHERSAGKNSVQVVMKKGKRRGPRGGVVEPFPVKLHKLLSGAYEKDVDSVISWQPHGRCFVIHKPVAFVEEIIPRYFKHSKLTSFQRQLNLYGFFRLTKGRDRGGYYHELFIRGRPDLCKRMVRTCVKGTGTKAASSPATEPSFYEMETCFESKPINVNGAMFAATNGGKFSPERKFEYFPKIQKSTLFEGDLKNHDKLLPQVYLGHNYLQDWEKPEVDDKTTDSSSAVSLHSMGDTVFIPAPKNPVIMTQTWSDKIGVDDNFIANPQSLIKPRFHSVLPSASTDLERQSSKLSSLPSCSSISLSPTPYQSRDQRNFECSSMNEVQSSVFFGDLDNWASMETSLCKGLQNRF